VEELVQHIQKSTKIILLIKLWNKFTDDFDLFSSSSCCFVAFEFEEIMPRRAASFLSRSNCRCLRSSVEFVAENFCDGLKENK
jgi:hypothetical protein